MVLIRLAAASCAVLLVVCANGCLTPDQIAALQKDVSDTRLQMEALRKEQERTTAKVDKIQSFVTTDKDGGREQAAETKRQIEAIRDDIRGVNSRLDEIQHRLLGLSTVTPGAVPRASNNLPSAPLAGAAGGAPEGTPAEGSGQPAAPARGQGGGGGGADDLFNGAYADYSKGNYAPSILGFEEFIQRFPASDRTDDAIYWIGLCHYDQGEYAEAIAEFDKVIQQFPNGDKVTAAHLKKGLSLLEMSRTAQGVVQLQHVVELFPRSEEARIARDRLKEIGVKP